MKEEKFTLGAEKQMVWRVGWSGGLTAPPWWGRGGEMLLRNLDRLATSPEKNSLSYEDSRGEESLRILIFRTGDFLEMVLVKGRVGLEGFPVLRKMRYEVSWRT